MAVRRWRGVPFGNLSECPNGSRWILDVFHECAQDSRDISSIILGLVSIFCFAAASFPQFYQACKTGIMDRALSIYFLLGWLGGDLLNLIGSFLADQLPLQVYTAVYYVLADLVMLSLYCYYRVKNRGARFTAPINAAFVFLSMGTVSTLSLLGSGTSTEGPGTFRGRSLLSVHMDDPGSKPFTRSEIIGFTIGSVSSVLYLCSRLPQIYTNYKRKSTTGISYSLFALVMLGNSLYGLSVLLKNPEPGQGEGDYVLHHLPWLVGSLGVLSLDVVISFQFLAYRKGRASTHEERDALLGEQGDSLES
ncbi:lysosomal amino acid transporter 1 homolog [Neopelma chrysocephalum]|uniref:lysosomal amino acid transporter 1 homolog n=1 Tax=Neopelma chrysocephalum TaxID=114329 RepID=UPI000FCCF508|nr:lysosomal amino acid transporter 1 homolog [Neopelma chrysocephalum]XP_027548921.1 lysosomal amino acid transporter 1 homolog [Neopelma chrysocephalum]